ncbi:TPR-like protein [Fusarium heterosporum]|uniref:TPR-like protein n=1 Tax=Fusarium heterosporum TaxID=42747 RepID=A0A8H5TC73_FUSHE|nr:TPR-like protein [Fusarium heterosporum]
MDPWTTTPDFLGEFAFAEQQNHTHYGIDSVSSTSQQLALGMHLAPDEGSHQLNSLQSWVQRSQNEASSNNTKDTQMMPLTPMGPPPKTRKPKAPTRRAKDWEPYKARILELHITQKLPLKQVKELIEDEFGFIAGPVALFCRTVSDSGSLAPSPIYSVRSLGVTHGDAMSIASSPNVSSPALSVSTIGQSQNSHFTGRSPAPIFRTLPNQFPPVHHPTADPLLQGQADYTSSVSRHRYRQGDEDRLREELSVAEMLFGTGHTQTLEIQAELAGVLVDQGRYKSAEAMSRRVVEGYRNANGNDNINMLDALELLGCTLRLQDFCRQAHKLPQRSFESKKAILGEDHPSTMNCLHIGKEQWKEAEELGAQLKKTSEEILGEQHPKTLLTTGLLIDVYIGQGRWKEAEEFGSQLKKTSEEILGEQHPETLRIMYLLIEVYIGQGRWKEAEESGLRALQILIKVVGEKHPYTLITKDQLTHIYESRGQHQKARELRVS